MIYSLPYIFFVMLLCALAVVVSQRKDDALLCRYVELGGVFLFFFFFAFRGYIWHDWTYYYPIYEKLDWTDLLNYDYTKHREPLWLILELLCKTITSSYQFLVIVVAGINTFLLTRFFRRYGSSLLFGLAVFLAFYGYEISINLLRNSISILLFLNALEYIYKRQFLKYLLCCVLACGMHLSAIIYLPLYFFLHRSMNRWVFLGLVVLSNAIMFSNFSVVMFVVKLMGIGNELLEQKIEDYTEMGTYAGSRFVLLQRFIICFMVFCYYNKLRQLRKENTMFINALLIFVLGSYLTSEFTEMSNRIGMLFAFSFWILCGYLINCFYYMNNRRLFVFFTGFVLLFNTYVNTNEYLKEYQNIFFGADSYEMRIRNYNMNYEDNKQIDSNKADQ